jgi:D-arabinose 1-dehydrogenase-like Zn-dependent alcohol dehydrogenase
LIFRDLRIRGTSSQLITKIGSLYASVLDAEEMLRDIAGDPVQVVKRIYEFEKVNEAVEDSKRGGKIVVEFLKEK